MQLTEAQSALPTGRKLGSFLAKRARKVAAFAQNEIAVTTMRGSQRERFEGIKFTS